ncbi:DUF2513 domain-containing protein [Brochothrix thermosphacta]|uniref:DUF2513 domain-containing protein n=1 Tax=Brochothrix thermosphacta TaxID=2756 RepID=UPI003F996DC2
MKLNHDLVRDILLFIESHQIDSNMDIGSSQLVEVADKHHATFEEIEYTVDRIAEAGFINSIPDMGETYIIESITWDGHEFLDNVRDPTIWNKTKQTASKLSSVSMPIIAGIAIKHIAEILGI